MHGIKLIKVIILFGVNCLNGAGLAGSPEDATLSLTYSLQKQTLVASIRWRLQLHGYPAIDYMAYAYKEGESIYKARIKRRGSGALYLGHISPLSENRKEDIKAKLIAELVACDSY